MDPNHYYPISYVSSLICLLIAASSLKAESIPAKDSHPSTPSSTSASAPSVPPPPLPLHQIEGNGGIFSTLSAYLVNPARPGETIGRPSVGFAHVHLGHGRNLEAFTFTETIGSRLELGYGWNYFELGDLPQAVRRATGMVMDNDSVQLHHANARLQVIKENSFDQSWMPAFTLGVHYKNNDGIRQINTDLAGTLQAIGIRENDHVDFTGYASKLITGLPRPLLLNLGMRVTRAAQLGFLGFTDSWSPVFEGSLAVFVTPCLLVAAEFKQKPFDFQRIPGLIEREDHWWTLDAAYVVNSHFTVAAGYGHFGQVLNHEANGVWGITTKWEF